ncbi:UNVERIFIED_CONTAM: hypothetical protein FKN15_064784 [Acipenser sinensis]
MLLKAERRAPAQPPQQREPAPPGAEQQEWPLPPPLPGAEEQELPLLPVLPLQGVRWPEPQKGELAPIAAISLPEIVGEVQRPAPIAAISLPEIVGEVQRPAPIAAISLPEIVGEVQRPAPIAAISLPEIVGEVQRPAPMAAVSLQEFLWPEPHRRELPATKKGEVRRPPAPTAFPLPGLSQLKESRLLTAWPVAAWLLAALPPVGQLKSPFPGRDFVLDCWVFKGGGGR